MRSSRWSGRTIRSIAPAGAWLVLAGGALAQYQDTSADSARAYSNNRTDANISDQGSGYGPAPYGPYGPYYSRSGAPSAQNRAGAQQTGGLPNPGVPIPSGQTWNEWYRINRPPVIDAGITWTEADEKLIAEKVTPDGQMDRLGLKPGDELVTVDGRPVHSAGEWRQIVGLLRPGQAVVLVVRREGQLTALSWTIPAAEPPGAAPGNLEEVGRPGPLEFISAARLRAGRQGQGRLGVVLEKDPNRAVIHAVDQGGAAAEAGLQPGDIIESLGGWAIASPEDLIQIVSQTRPGSTVSLYVARGDKAPAVESVAPSPAE